MKCMLNTAKLPKQYWGEAVRIVVYFSNQSPSVLLGFDIPETRKGASCYHLKVFGCKTFVHVPKEQRSKFDYKATPSVFLGYGEEEFGYRLWDPNAKKFIKSRDVIFREDQTLGDSDEQPAGAVKEVDPLASDDEEQQGDINEVVPGIHKADNDEMPLEPKTRDQGESDQDESNQGEPPAPQEGEAQLRRSNNV